MCVGLSATFTESFLDYFLKGRLGLVNRRLISMYFGRVRVCRTIHEPDPAELRASRVDLCDCRLVKRNCDHRIDLCFKLDDHSRNSPPPFDPVALSDAMHRRGLVRMRVETLGKKVENCHCCPCCCQALRVARRFGPGYVLPSDARPVTSDQCRKCGLCIPACPIGVRSAGEFDPERCLGCGVCTGACPEQAIRMQPNEVTAPRTRERMLPAPTASGGTIWGPLKCIRATGTSNCT